MQSKDQKSIILYGIGFEGEKFWCKFHRDVRIVYCIDGKEQPFFHGIPVYRLEEKQEEMKGYFTIVASTEYVYRDIKKSLLLCGLVEYTDFIPASAYGKKLAIIYGNCHMDVLQKYLRQSPEFIRTYYIRLFIIWQNQCPSDLELTICSLLITQDIRENNILNMPAYEALTGKIKGNCKTIIVPNLFGVNLFYPQYLGYGNEEDGRLDWHFMGESVSLDMYELDKQEELRSRAKSVAVRDAYIDKMYDEGQVTDKIVWEIENGIMYDHDEIRDNFSRQIDKLKDRERECDIKISDYIEENYQEKYLFYDPGHPTEELICEKGERILKLLGFESIPENRRVIGMIDDKELPIYGCVKKALGIKYEQKYLRMTNLHTLSNAPVTIDEYVRDYITWKYGETQKGSEE